MVAPRSPNIDAFARNLAVVGELADAVRGLRPDNFLVGQPEFSFEDYHGWIDERFPPSRFRQLQEKMDLDDPVRGRRPSSRRLGQNPGIEQELQRLGTRTHVYVGTGIGNVLTIARAGARSTTGRSARWDRFWAERNPELARPGWDEPAKPDGRAAADPESLPAEERADADRAWWQYWAGLLPRPAHLPRRARRDRVASPSRATSRAAR